jgi:hypothetical protein
MMCFQQLLDQLTEHWRSDGVKVPAGVDESMIRQFESSRSVKLPYDMRQYFLTVNGMGVMGECDEELFYFWPLHEVTSIADYLPNRADKFADSAKYFLFADHSINLPSYAIHLNQFDNHSNRVAVVYSDAKHLFVQDFFNSFADFLSKYLCDPVGTGACFPDEVQSADKHENEK